MTLKKKILIIEDDGAICRLARRMLKSLDVDSVDAPDGCTALKHLRAEGASFDAVLTDMRLPDIHGIELTDWIRELFPEMPVIFFSGDHLNEQAQQRLEEDNTFFLSKPFSKTTLSDVVHRVFAVC